MNDAVNKGIENYVRALFQNLRLNLLGPEAIDKAYAFVLRDSKFDPSTTVDSLYYQANLANNPDLKDADTLKDDESLKRIKTVAEQYITQLEEKTIADVKRVVGSAYHDADLQAKLTGGKAEEILVDNKEILERVSEAIEDIQERLGRAVSALVENELYTAQNFGAMDGILAAARAIGQDDPTVCKIGVMDEKRCKHCWRLWTLSDKITPKVYKLSELAASPGHWKNPVASVGTTHVNCRDVLVTIMPGFGFSGGQIVYKGIDPETGELWDEYKHQRERLRE
ncbi:MAG: hypothetical protein QXT45_07190 [Candidatus Bilamarchaeaceae archaeon]